MKREDEFTDAERRVLTVLARRGGRLLGPGTIGGEVWGTPHRKPQNYARTAGRVLNRLKDRGLVEWTSFRDAKGESQDWGWRLTTRGRETFGKEVERMDTKRMGEAVRGLIEAVGFEIREGYSGRGMNGKSCLAFAVGTRGVTGVFEAAVELTAQAASEFEGIDEFEEVIQALKGAKTDDLGLGSVVYFPDISTEE